MMGSEGGALLLLLCRGGTLLAFLILKFRPFADIHIETAKQKSGQQDDQG